MYFLKILRLCSRTWSMQTKRIVMMSKERSTKIVNFMTPRAGVLNRGVVICYRVMYLMAELSPNLQRLDRGRIQQTPVSPNRHQQRTEDQRTHHQRPSPIIIHIGQKFRLGPTKILSDKPCKREMFLLKPRFECFHIGVIHVFLSFIFKGFFMLKRKKIIKN